MSGEAKLLQQLKKFGFNVVPYEFLLFERFEERMDKLTLSKNEYKAEENENRKASLINDFRRLILLYSEVYGPMMFPKTELRLSSRKPLSDAEE